ncbi:MAG: 50S ribosomal protein L15 [Deltaproteobacteria bacterium RIFCSPLOWO2_02_FULL_53_8]|nr:MAG: 50S ribosomal protein L15 [Deltaproteobacteria bacterium RIFCSPLOWO2_02_FULL_53_8]
MLDRLKAPKGAVKNRKRVGRGEGGGSGKTSGKGGKGQTARSGGNIKPGFEGGQMPLQRRLPKRGFTNIFKQKVRIVNLGRIAEMFANGEAVTIEALLKKRLIRPGKGPVKVLSEGDLNTALTIQANLFSAGAIDKIKAAGGAAEVI